MPDSGIQRVGSGWHGHLYGGSQPGISLGFPRNRTRHGSGGAANPGTTIVNGGIPGFSDVDWFEITGLGSGSFTLSATMTSGGASINVFADTDLVNALESQALVDSGTPANFGALAIPSDGNVAVELAGSNEGSNPYTVTLTTTGSSTPEPGTIATVGLGLAGAFILRRKRQAFR